jgi:hypothetical protein
VRQRPLVQEVLPHLGLLLMARIAIITNDRAGTVHRSVGGAHSAMQTAVIVN